MKQAVVNGRWNLWLPDSIADWDAITGDYAARRGWEFARFESFRRHLRYGDLFFDVGSEHGWISAIIAREFVGGHNMVLVEPSPEFWGNIRMTWTYNNLDGPFATFQGFASAATDSHEDLVVEGGWPTCALIYGETGAMAYRSLHNGGFGIPSMKLDDLAYFLGRSPDAINIDVEGAEYLVMMGATGLLGKPTSSLRNIWISVHPDLMERDFDRTPDHLMGFMELYGWSGEFLDEDHEQHWHFTRKG